MKKITVYIVLVLAVFATISCSTDDVDNELKLRDFSKIDYSKVYKGIKPTWADNFTVDTFYMQNSYDTVWKKNNNYPTTKQKRAVRSFKSLDYVGLWKDFAHSTDFSKLFDYRDKDELKVMSSKKLIFSITDWQREIKEKDSVSYVVSTIEIKKGIARVKEYIVINTDNTIKQKVVFNDSRRGELQKIKDRDFYIEKKGILIEGNAVKNIHTISNYLAANLKDKADGIIIELKVFADSASVYCL